MKTKRVLIADDEVRVATTLADSLERLGEEYVFDIVHNGIDALAHLKEKDYVLLITDYKMPGMNGLELAQAARQINDKIQVILMTAYGTSDLRNTVRDGSTSGYIEKPFSVAEIRDVVRRAIENTRPGAHSASHEKQTVVQSAQKCLKELQANTGARCILLINSNGFPLEVVGGDKTLDVVSIGALVAANFMAAAELANLLGNRSVFKSSYHEGEDFNVYSYYINPDALLAVVFGAESKIGAVWLYTKQTAATLVPLMEMNPLSQKIPDELQDVAMNLSADLDNLFKDIHL